MINSYHYIMLDNIRYRVNIYKFFDGLEHGINVNIKDGRTFSGFRFIFKCNLKDFQKKLLKYHLNILKGLED